MTASEILKNFIVEETNKCSEERFESYDDLLKHCNDLDNPYLIRNVIIRNDIYFSYNRWEDSIYEWSYVFNIDNKLIGISFLEDEDNPIGNEILLGIDEANFVEAYQETRTLYRKVC